MLPLNKFVNSGKLFGVLLLVKVKFGVEFVSMTSGQYISNLTYDVKIV